MRRVLYDKTGLPQHYLTGAGVLFDTANIPVAALQDGQIVNPEGRVVAWFDGSFIWDASGVLAFVKGAVLQGTLVLPKTAPLRIKPSATPAPLHPLLVRLEPPPIIWVWSEKTLTDVLAAGHRA